jgi:opacity protein-like surface antigen
MLRYFSISVIITFTTILFFGMMVDVNAQQSDTGEEYHRFSISVQGGLTFENNDLGLRLIGSNFNRLTDHSYNFGGGVQYAITPLWSVGAEYRYTTIDGFDLFETEVHSVTLKNYFNMNRLYRQHRISEYINPFLTFGLGRDFFTYESDTESISNHEFHLNSGFGLAFALNNNIELFGQYELQFSSNSLDNIREGFPSDLIGMATGGIRLHIGSRDKKRMSLTPRRIYLNELEYNDIKMRGERIAQLEQQMESSQAKISSLDSDQQKRNREFEERISRMQSTLEDHEERIRKLEESLEGIEVRADESPVIRDGLPAGHYVQVFAARDENRAQQIRQHVISLLAEVTDNPDDYVIVTLRKQFYEIRVGPYSRLADAREIQNHLLDAYQNAFVVTFPRPANLREEYIDIHIIH